MTAPAVPPDALAWLQRHLRRNRFLPMPPAGLQDVGDGDWREIGAEFLGWFVRFGGLLPSAAVLDLGCGNGRMALPLTQYLDPATGSYRGFDVVAPGVDWCRRAISAQYGNFAFDHLDFRHPLYNPDGRLALTAQPLPYAAGSFDFAILTSVFTHLGPDETLFYLGELRRLLRPGGRCFASLMLMEDEARRALAEHPGRLAFDPAGGGPVHAADRERPLAAVAVDEGWFLTAAAAAGLCLVRPVARGTWCGRAGESYQDLCLLERRK